MKLRILNEQQVGPDVSQRQRVLSAFWEAAVAAEGEAATFVAVYHQYQTEDPTWCLLSFCVADQTDGTIEFQPDFEVYKVFPVPSEMGRDTTTTWQKIDQETTHHQVQRSYDRDFEVYEDAVTVRIYVAKKQLS